MANNKRFFHFVTQPPWKTIIPASLLLILFLIGYPLWSPGKTVVDGRHDLRQNGIWIQHGWLGDDTWFERNSRSKELFRSQEHIQALTKLLTEHHIRYVYPHLCPCRSDGTLPPVDAKQTQLFLKEMPDFSVLPWIGGVLNEHVDLSSAEWRDTFIQSSVKLLKEYPQFAGVHINIEPLPSGTKDYIVFLEEFKKRMPGNKILSVSAYPPPTKLHPFPEVHWDEAFYKEIDLHVDQMVVMMYDTSIQWNKVYQYVIAQWTQKVLFWAPNSKILLGVSAYDDDEDYHNPRVENVDNSLKGIHAGLLSFDELPANYQGAAIYCEWEMTQRKWEAFKDNFLAE